MAWEHRRQGGTWLSGPSWVLITMYFSGLQCREGVFVGRIRLVGRYFVLLAASFVYVALC